MPAFALIGVLLIVCGGVVVTHRRRLPLTIPRGPDGVVRFDALPAAHEAQPPVDFLGAIRRDDRADRPTLHLQRLIAIDPFRAAIPGVN